MRYNVSTVPLSLVCGSGSMFRPRLRNGAKIPSYRGLKSPNTPSKWSHDRVCRRLRANAAPIELRASSIPNIHAILSTISGTVTSFGRPGRSSSIMLVRPRLNSAVQYLIVYNEGVGSPYTASNSVLISPLFFPFKNKYLITARISILSIFVNS